VERDTCRQHGDTQTAGHRLTQTHSTKKDSQGHVKDSVARSFESLSDISKCDSERLDGTVWVLKVQRVSIVVNTTKLHHLNTIQHSTGKNVNYHSREVYRTAK